MMRIRRLRTAGNLTILTAALFGVAVESEEAAYALQGGEDPALLPVLIDKRYGSASRWQFSALFSTAMVTKFVEGTGGYLSATYNPWDLLGFELGGGFFASQETALVTNPLGIRDRYNGQEPPLSDLYQLNWLVNGSVVLVPVYGKISFASELDPAFDIFLLGGGGLAGTRRALKANGVDTYDKKTVPTFHVGFGLRFYIIKWLALRFELRDYFYTTDVCSVCGFTADAGAGTGGLSSELHFQGGVQFTFGGAQ